MVLSPPSFVSSASWFKCRDALLANMPPEDEQRQKIYRSIDTRNEQLVASCNKTPPAARQILVKMLDTTLQSPLSDDHLPSTCWDITTDKPNLVRALLEWCTSMYRPGFAKIYVTSRILHVWSTRGSDVTAAVLDFLGSGVVEQHKTALYHLVRELTRSGRFSIPRYCQWLMARGGVLAPADVSPDGPCATRLLVELPTHSLGPSQRSLRANMLRRAGYYVEDEAQDHDLAVKCLKHSLGMPLDLDDPALPQKPLPISKLAKRIARSSFALKADVGSWLHNSLLASFESAAKESSSLPEMSPTTFNAMRTVFEAAEDFSMLAGVLKAVSSVSSIDVLASCADTVSRHVLAFAALGAATSLFDTLYVRLRTTAEEHGIGARPLLASLACLASRLPEKQGIASQLKRDLAQTDRNNPVDACSPVSDNMGARVQDDDADLQEEIEKNLMSGTSVDRATMNMLFEAVATRLNTWWGHHAEKQRRYGMLLARLRGFDHQQFDSLVGKWIRHLRSITNRPSILRMFPLLMGVGCLSFPLLLASTSAEQSAPAGGTSRPPPNGPSGPAQTVQLTYPTRYCQEVLVMVMKPLVPDDLLSPEECYRIAIMQDQALKDNSSEILALVRQALAEYSLCRDKGDTDALPLDNVVEREHLIDMLRRLVLIDSAAVIKALSLRSGDPHVGSWIDCMATKLLIPTAPDDAQVSFDQILERTDEFTLPFCQLKISLSLSLADQNSPDAGEPVQSHLDLFTKAMDNAIDAENTSWTGMLSSLSPEITHHLKSRAQTRFLDLLPSLSAPPSGDDTVEQRLQTAENLLSVVDAIIRGGSMGRPPQLVPAMVDKLVDLWEVLSSPSTDAGGKNAVLNHWLPALLALVTLHTSTLDSSKAGFEVRARAVIALSGLLQELSALPPATVLAATDKACPPPPNSSSSTPPVTLANRVFDLACLLVDNLNDDVRNQCLRVVANAAAADARLRYIFSSARNPAEHLMLSHKDRDINNNKTAATTAAGPAAAAGGRPQLGPGHLLGTPASLWAQTAQGPERLSVFHFRRWEMLNEPTPNVGENDTALSLGLFEARKAS